MAEKRLYVRYAQGAVPRRSREAAGALQQRRKGGVLRPSGSSCNIARRAFLATVGVLGVSSVAGCSLLRRRPETMCPDDPRYSDGAKPLTVDVHAHFFNASDLQVKQFIDQVALKQKGPFGDAARVLSGVLQDVSWEAAPSAKEELEMLRKLAPVLAKCEASGSNAALAGLRDAAYRSARSELNAALERTGRSGPTATGRSYTAQSALERRLGNATAQADFLVRHLPETHDEYLQQRQSRAAIRRSEPTVQGTIDFVIQNFQYRYVSVHDYLETYSRGATRRVDLLVAHLVDYDWWLARGQPTRTTLRDQVGVMEEISLLTGGRVHAFAPFDPFREVMSTLEGGDSSLALVRQAVHERGCIGVKLYPPMGFAAWGNAALDVWKDSSWLPDVVLRPDFGKRLDDAMAALFTWAREEQVPITAHTNVSNGPARRFEELATAKYWKQALEQFDRGGKNLRIDFAHFGDTEMVGEGPGHSEALVDLMSTSAGSRGAKAFADASYFSDVLNSAEKLTGILKALYLRQSGLLAKRLMYGSDWEMSLVERNVESYLSGFEQLYDGLRTDLEQHGDQWRTLADDFFGRNATDFLGLRKGEATRMRLEEFYRGRVATPAWMKKVDALA
jgi:hypothetical protein